MRTLLTLFLSIAFFAVIAQTTKENPIKDYEACIINKTIPTEQYSYKYNDSDRVIVWNDKLIRNYKYTDEAFDTLGYDFVKTTTGDNSKHSKIYRNCTKGIIIEVTEWYNVKLSISMNWYAKSKRKGIGYLMYCNLLAKDNTNKIKGTFYYASFFGSGKNDPYDNPTKKDAKVFISDSIVKITLADSSIVYKLDYKPKVKTDRDDYLISYNETPFILSISKMSDYSGTYYILKLSKNPSFEKLWTIPEARCYENYEISK